MSKRVLFIDDELDEWLNALDEELREYGFEVTGEEDPSMALDVIDRDAPDVVLLDILFNGRNLGRRTLGEIKARHPELPVMMITSTMDKEEYRSEDYVLADYRYAKLALVDGDFSDLARQLDRLIAEREQKKGGMDDEDGDDAGLSRYGFIVGRTPAMKSLVRIVQKVADQDITVLVTGESGVGKELLAKAMHNLSTRNPNPFSTIVCAAMPKNLLESELFGHEKGAFSGAHTTKKGKFELAGAGTIFLDEIAELFLDTQVKLLRFLQERTFDRVGGNETLTSGARIIAATNRDLEKMIREGSFREDLYFRINVVALRVPPLRERKEDIPAFFRHFVNKINDVSSRKILPILREDVRKRLTEHDWPGNVRELENSIRRAAALADENILQVDNFSIQAERKEGGRGVYLDLNEIVERIYRGELSWKNLKDQFAARGSMRRDILRALVHREMRGRNRRPSSEELAGLLSVSPGNMRRILSECGIKLTQI